MGVLIRLLSPSAVQVRKFAQRVGEAVRRRRGGVSVDTVRGFLIRAAGTADNVVVTVIDPPGAVVMPDPLSTADGNYYAIGTRDVFDSTLSITPPVYTRPDIPVDTKAVTPALIGLVATDPAWIDSVPWPAHTASTRQTDRLYASRFRVQANTPGFPYTGTDQLPTTDVVFAGVDVFPGYTGAPSYYFSDAAVDDMASGYQLSARTDVGYMAWEYQTLQPPTARIGALSLVVLPVVKNLDPGEAVHWGHSALLFVVLDAEKARSDEDPIVASSLWTPDSHSSAFFHNGEWLKKPAGTVTSPYSAPQASWNAFWVTPDTSGGSRPNWMDAVSVEAFNGRFVVTVRLCALNGAIHTPSGVYTMAGGSGVMRFDVSTAGGVTVTEGPYEVWAFDRDTDNDAPYDVFVAGALDTAEVHAVNPMGLLASPTDLLDIRLCVDASRTDFTAIVGGLQAQARPTADMTTARLEVAVTRLDALGVELPAVTHSVVFSALDAGMSCPVIYQGGKYQLIAPTQSYKLWPANNQFVRLSDTELAFVVRDDWQVISPGGDSAVSLAVLDLVTGVATIRGSVGVSTAENISYARSEHLCCIQQTQRDGGGVVVTHGALLFSSRYKNEVRISVDSGATWQDYISFPRPQSGAYYIGNALMAGMRPGRFIR